MSHRIAPPSTFLRLTPDVSVPVTQPSTFLSLAPDVSPSYPQAPLARQPASEGEAATEVLPSRKSSVGSSNRILKLGPVHWGEHLEEHKDDFHDVPSP